MDLRKVIKELSEERKRIDALIADLEQLSAVKQTAERRVVESALKHRGRKAVGPEERVEISRRMRSYWAERRKKLHSNSGNLEASIAE